MQAYKAIPQAVKMDLRAFWRVVAMVPGLVSCPVYGLIVYQFCYMRYITISQTENSTENEKKTPQGKVPCGFNFVRYAHAHFKSYVPVL